MPSKREDERTYLKEKVGDYMSASQAGVVVPAGWPDVGMALVRFAREDLWGFLAIFVVLIAGLWLLYQRPTAMLREAYRIARARLTGEEDDD